MMERIDLAPLLRETVATSYTDLVTRPTGGAGMGQLTIPMNPISSPQRRQ